MFELQGGGSPLSGFERARGVLAAGKKVTARLLFALFSGKRRGGRCSFTRRRYISVSCFIPYIYIEFY